MSLRDIPRKASKDNGKPKRIVEPDKYKNPRLKQIHELMRSRKVKGNPRDFVVVVGGDTLIDRSGVFEISAQLSAKLEPGNHVWMRFVEKGMERVLRRIVVEDEGKTLMIKDEEETFTQRVERIEVSALPLPKSPILIKKKLLDRYLGPAWKNRFWDSKLNRRRSKPWPRKN